MSVFYQREKKTTTLLTATFTILLLIHLGTFVYMYIQTRPVYLFDEGEEISSLTIRFEEEAIVLNREEEDWFEEDSRYFADHKRVNNIRRFMKHTPVQEIDMDEEEEVSAQFIVELEDFSPLEVYHFIDETNRTVVKKDGQYYALPGNFLEYLSRRRDRFLSRTVVPERHWQNIKAVSFWQDEEFEFVRQEDEWKEMLLEEGLSVRDEKVYDLVMAPIFLHLVDRTGVSLTEHYDQVDVRLYYEDGSEMSLYYYYPVSGEGLTYIAVPEYNITLGTREFAGNYLELLSSLDLR